MCATPRCLHLLLAVYSVSLRVITNPPREVSTVSTGTVARRVSVPLPSDPLARYALLEPLAGRFVLLTSGDFEVEGVLVAVLFPAIHAENPAPVVVIDTGTERIAGPVLAGDVLT